MGNAKKESQILKRKYFMLSVKTRMAKKRHPQSVHKYHPHVITSTTTIPQSHCCQLSTTIIITILPPFSYSDFTTSNATVPPSSTAPPCYHSQHHHHNNCFYYHHQYHNYILSTLHKENVFRLKAILICGKISHLRWLCVMKCKMQTNRTNENNCTK